MLLIVFCTSLWTLSVSFWSGQGRWLIKAADRDDELTTMNNSTGKDRHRLLASLIICGQTSWMNCGRSSFLSVRISSSKATFCWVFFLVFWFSWSSINCSTELMSANLEDIILWKKGTLQTFTLNYFTWPLRKAGKTDTNFLTCEKNRISLLIGHTIFFTSEKKVWPVRLLLIK